MWFPRSPSRESRESLVASRRASVAAAARAGGERGDAELCCGDAEPGDGQHLGAAAELHGARRAATPGWARRGAFLRWRRCLRCARRCGLTSLSQQLCGGQSGGHVRQAVLGRGAADDRRAVWQGADEPGHEQREHRRLADAARGGRTARPSTTRSSRWRTRPTRSSASTASRAWSSRWRRCQRPAFRASASARAS